MSGISNFANAMTSSVAPATATAQGLSNWYNVASAVKALGTVGAGFAQMQAANAEAGALQQQSNIALQEAQYGAQQKQREVLQTAAQQSEDYASSGITLEGSPALVLDQTRRLGQQEVNQIQKRGQYQAQLLRTQALRQKSAGRMALFGGIANGSLGLLDSYIQGRGTFGKTASSPVGRATPLPPSYGPNGYITP